MINESGGMEGTLASQCIGNRRSAVVGGSRLQHKGPRSTFDSSCHLPSSTGKFH